MTTDIWEKLWAINDQWEQIRNKSNTIYLVEDQTDEFLRQLNRFSEESDPQGKFGYVRLSGNLTAVNVSLLAWGLRFKSQRWIRDVLNTSHYYRIRPSEENLRALWRTISDNNVFDGWEFYQLNEQKI